MRRNKWRVMIVSLAAAVLFVGANVASASTDPGLPTCTQMSRKVKICVPTWAGKPDFVAIDKVINEVLVGEYPAMTIYMISEKVMAENFGGYYLDRGVILLVAKEGIGNAFIHELWHHRLSTEGVLVADQHCTMGKSEAYAWSTRLKGDDLRNHRFQLLLQCEGMFADYPPEE